jgi:hypothetical protein
MYNNSAQANAQQNQAKKTVCDYLELCGCMSGLYTTGGMVDLTVVHSNDFAVD